MIAAGGLGALHFVHGSYLQDWLLEPTDFSWRLEPDKGRASSAIGDIGQHWVMSSSASPAMAPRPSSREYHDRRLEPG